MDSGHEDTEKEGALVVWLDGYMHGDTGMRYGYEGV